MNKNLTKDQPMENIINRNVMLYGEITTESIKEVMQQLMDILQYDFHMEQTVKDYHRDEIYFNICSGGGEVNAAAGLCEFIKYSPTPIVTVAYGMACSAAFMILSCGHYRLATKGSALMMHHMSGGNFGSTRDCENSIAYWKKLDQYMINLLKENTEIPESLIDEIYKEQIDKYFTLEEAIEMKIIDDIYGQEKPIVEEISEDVDEEILEEDEPANI